jgi:rhodanese-related sulfurtransferase
MGGRHPRFWAEVDLPKKNATAVEEVARAHGLTVLVGPSRLGLSAGEQVDALRKKFPELKIHELPHPPLPEAKKHNPAFEKLCEEVRQRVREISVEEAHRRTHAGSAKLLDIREDHEWSDGRAANATHLGRGILERDIEKLVPETGAEIILYCGGGYRSALAAENLQRMGYTNVLSMRGGWRAWKQAGLPEER